MVSLVVWWFGGLVVWWFGGLVVWWFGGLVVWWFGQLICKKPAFQQTVCSQSQPQSEIITKVLKAAKTAKFALKYKARY
jgi:hypothetical protein